MSDYSEWLERQETRVDVVTEEAVSRFRATLDTAPVDGVPQGFHWCTTLPLTPTEALGTDGHPPKGGFLPPIELPRRMWAASKVEFLSPIPLGAVIERTSRVSSITEKAGKTGALVFVEVMHQIKANEQEAINETQTIVYREATTKKSPLPPDSLPDGGLVDLSEWDWTRALTPQATHLFRYSALTFNSHRIHYDRDYAEQEELYPGLVVQGPLMATLLLDHAARKFGPDALAAFSFRGLSPAFAGQDLHLVGRGDRDLALRVIGADGRTVMEASAVRAG